MQHKVFITCIIVFLILPSVQLFSQVYYNKMEIPEVEATDSLNFAIDKIEIAGNDKTRDYILLRELHFTTGDTASIRTLFLAQKRLLNLFLFNRVTFDLIGDDSRVILLITVAERWYLFPLPILYLNERSWDKISYGGKLLYYNFRGRNILLNLTLAFGYNPEMKLSYRDPWFGGSLKLMTNVSVFHKKVRSNNLDFDHVDDERSGIDWLIGRRFGHYLSTYISLGYTQLSHPELTLSPTGTDKYSVVALHARFDNRDLHEYPHEGMDLHLWGLRVQYREPITYHRYGGEWQQYIPVGTYSTIALRTKANLGQGTIPLYDHMFLGFGNRIRGEFHDKYEGENLLMGSIEFRFPIKKITYFDITELAPPGFESYYQNLKFGISAGIFYDIGAVWYQNEPLQQRHRHDGFGFGLHFHVPYVELIRFEMAFDRELNYQFIAETGLAF